MKSKSHFQMNNALNGTTEFFQKDVNGNITGNFGTKIELDGSGRGFTVFHTNGSSEHFYPDASNGGFMGSNGTHVDYGPNNNFGYRPIANGVGYDPVEGLLSGAGGIFLLIMTVCCFVDALIAIKLAAVPYLLLILVGIVFVVAMHSKFWLFDQEIFCMAQIFFFIGVFMLASLIMKRYGGTYDSGRGVMALVGLLVIGCAIEVILMSKMAISFGNVLYCFGLLYAIVCSLFYNSPELPFILAPPLGIVLIIAIIAFILFLRDILLYKTRK